MEKGYIHLKTKNTSYVLKVNAYGHLENLYYGALLSDEEDFSVLENKQQNMLGTSTIYSGEPDSKYSLDFVNLEVSTIGKGDYRKPSILLEHDLGFVSDFIVIEHGEGKKEDLAKNSLPIPKDFDRYYYVVLEDKISKTVIKLDYLIFEAANVIARRVVVTKSTAKLLKVASFNLDMVNNQYDVYYTFGAWANEIRPVRTKINPGTFEISTLAGPSSNRHNPFFLLLGKDTSLNVGKAYGFNLIYSGPFKATIERNAYNNLRINHGINDETFSKTLKEDEVFITPFAILTFSELGENGVSHNFHHFIKHHVVRKEYATKARPILLNNWEATYFSFNEQKIKALINKASTLGIELFVLDDGWFINRDNDYTGLGNYEIDHKKLPHGLKGLSDYARKKEMKFGLWFEPEMVSKDSDIFKNHPEWVIQIPGITPSTGRFQYALNLALKEVQTFIIENVSRTLKSADISYVKWDYNRNLSDFYTVNNAFSTFFYDYTVGLYNILNVLMNEFPDILWEGCASGGNRFDLGILSFFDQIWVSDCSDAYERIRMHSVLAKAYPLSVMSGHVSAIPNHQMLRNIPLQTRFNNAFMSGGFGYELDVTRLTPKESKEIKEYNRVAKVFQNLVINGTYYEFASGSQKDKKAYGVISDELDAALILISNGRYQTLPEINKLPAIPLNDEYTYTVTAIAQTTDIKTFGSLLNMVLPKFIKHDGAIINYLNKRKSAEELVKMPVLETFKVSGKVLKAGALTLYPEWSATGVNETTRMSQDFTSILYFITKDD